MMGRNGNGNAVSVLALLLLCAGTAFPAWGQSGFLNFELTWSTASDVDLYVKDPSGTTIFYSNTSSVTGGVYPFDDTSGTGPENAVWSLNAPAGVYEFWAQNFRGDFEQTCTFKVFMSGVQVGETKTGSLVAARQAETEHFFLQVGPPPAELPVAVIGTQGPFFGLAPFTVNFSAVGSTGGGGTAIGSYKWDFGDFTTTTTAVDSTQKVYNTPGVYVATLIVVNANGFQSVRALLPIVVGDGLTQDGDLFINKADFNINFAKHQAGINADALKITGTINPAGLLSDTEGVFATITVNGVSLNVLIDEANGRSEREVTAARAQGVKMNGVRAGAMAKQAFVLKPNGQFNLNLTGVDLRSVLGVTENTPDGTAMQNLEVNASIGGVPIATSSVSGAFETAVTTKKGAASKGSFGFITRSTFTGFFKSLKSSAKEADNGDYAFSASGPLLGEFGTSVIPNGPVTIRVGGSGGSGGAVLTVPLASLGVKGEGAKSVFTYSPKLGEVAGLKKLVITNAKRGFQLVTDPLTGTGIPASASAVTAASVPLELSVPTAAGTVSAKTTIEIIRKDGAKSWKR